MEKKIDKDDSPGTVTAYLQPLIRKLLHTKLRQVKSRAASADKIVRGLEECLWEIDCLTPREGSKD